MQRDRGANAKQKRKSSLSTSFFFVFCTISEIEVFMIDTGLVYGSTCLERLLLWQKTEELLVYHRKKGVSFLYFVFLYLCTLCLIESTSIFHPLYPPAYCCICFGVWSWIQNDSFVCLELHLPFIFRQEERERGKRKSLKAWYALINKPLPHYFAIY